MPKINLYRNISITFILFTAILLVAVFLFFSNKASILITPNPQEINLSFNLEIKENPTLTEIKEDDVVTGKLITYSKAGSGVFETLSTKTVSTEIVGKVKLVNDSGRDQTLVRTTQLQASNGAIVRTNEHAVVPGRGSVVVDVFAKDPDAFSSISPGNLVIIKLNPSLQDDIYGVSEKLLTDQPREVNILSNSDINRAKDKLSDELLAELVGEVGLSENDNFVLSVKSYNADKEIGAEVDSFTLNAEIDVRVLDVDDQQLADLIVKKVSSLSLSGLEIGKIDIKDIDYIIIEEDLDGSVLVKVNYSISTGINEQNPLLDRANFVGKSSDEVSDILTSQDLVKEVRVLVSPYWRHTLPRQESKIDITIGNY
jgi:hypothetical protein